jgi:hypothetical protein
VAEYDPKFIEELLDKPSEERGAYLDTLPPAERKSLGQALLDAWDERVGQELVANLRRNSLADQTQALAFQQRPPQAQ